MGLIGFKEKTLKLKAEQAKSIPSKVFFNHFFSIIYCIDFNEEKYDLKKIPFYNGIKVNNEKFNI